MPLSRRQSQKADSAVTTSAGSATPNTDPGAPGGQNRVPLTMPVTQIAEKDQSPRRHKFLGPRVPPNLFGIALGIAGLAQAWHAAVPVLGTAQPVPGALDVLAAALWLVLAGAYLAQGPRVVLADLRDPVLSPFVSASALTAMILSAALARHAFTVRCMSVPKAMPNRFAEPAGPGTFAALGPGLSPRSG